MRVMLGVHWGWRTSLEFLGRVSSGFGVGGYVSGFDHRS